MLDGPWSGDSEAQGSESVMMLGCPTNLTSGRYGHRPGTVYKAGRKLVSKSCQAPGMYWAPRKGERELMGEHTCQWEFAI